MYAHLIPKFLEVMNEIGAYGEQKYGSDSFQKRRERGNASRHIPRVQSGEIVAHIGQHAGAYAAGERHDRFGTLKHQLGAIAFNAMMEFHYAQLAEEEPWQ